MAIVFFATSCQFGNNQDVAIIFPQEIPQAQFASDAITNSVVDKGLKIQADGNQSIFLLSVNDEESIKKHGFSMPSDLKEEGFSLQVKDNIIGVIGHDPAGLMYGGTGAG